METNLFVVGAGLSGIIGVLAPFVMPRIFNLVGKIVKRELSKEEKRLTVTVFSVIIAVIVILVQYDWSGDIKADLNNLIQFFFVNFVAVKGMIQTIYELLIKNIPVLTERFS